MISNKTESVLAKAEQSAGRPRSGDFTVRPVRSKADMRLFKQLPRRLYAGDPVAVLPLGSLQDFVLDRERHPFYDHGRGASAEFFLAVENGTGRPVGRVAAIIDNRHNQHARKTNPRCELVGHFGFFDCVNSPQVARELIAAAADWLRPQGIRRMLGPASPSQSYDYGLLIDGHDQPHRFLMPYHPAYCAALLETAGLTKATDLLSLTGDLHAPRCRGQMERLVKRAAAMAARKSAGVTVRPISMRRYRAETHIIGGLLNDVLSEHFGHSPITEQEWQLIADSLRPVVDPNFILIAERNGTPVGLAIALPDINQIIGRLRLRFGFLEIIEFLVRSWCTRPDCITVVVVGATRKGNSFAVTGQLVGQLSHNLLARNVRFVDAHQVLEDNRGMLDPLLRHGLQVDRRYRVYQMEL